MHDEIRAVNQISMTQQAAISVAFFSNTDARGGAEEHMLTLLRSLDRSLFRLHLICTPHVLDDLRPDLPRDVQCYGLSFSKLTEVGAALALRSYLRRNRITILHSHLFYSSLFASPVGRAAGVPVILETPHLREVWRHGWKASYAIDRMVGRCVDRYIAVSKANAEYLVNAKRLPASKVTVVWNGCNLTRFDPALRPSAELKTSLGFRATDRMLLVAGRLEPQKGHRILLEAYPSLRREFSDLRLVCIGDGALRTELEAQARQLGIADDVRFLGFQPNVPEWIALADVNVLPSFFEGLPLIAIETLAMARPMVATAVDGTPEVIVHGKTGLTVPPGDPDKLAGAIARLLRDPELGRKLASAGRSWVMQHFTEQHQIEATEDLYLRECERKLNLVFRREPKEPAAAQKVSFGKAELLSRAE